MSKKISIQDIKSGALIGAPVAVKVQIIVEGEDCEFDTHIKPFSYATVVNRWKAIGGEKEQLAGTLASCICDAEGVLQFTEDDIRNLFSESLIEALWVKIIEVNKIGGKSQTKNSTKTNSSRNSSSGVSRRQSKQRRTSRTQKSSIGENTSDAAEVSTQVDESSSQSVD